MIALICEYISPCVDVLCLVTIDNLQRDASCDRGGFLRRVARFSKLLSRRLTDQHWPVNVL